MTDPTRQRRFAKRAWQASAVIGLAALAFFVVRGEPVTGVVLGALLGVGGYFEYRRRLTDLEMMDGDEEEDPFERRERYR